MNQRILASSPLFCALLTVPVIAQKASSPADEQLAAFYSGAEWREFLDRDPAGKWLVDWCAASGSPRAIYGSGIALRGWSENSLEAARVQANQLLRDHADLLRLGASDFRETIGARMGRTWSFTFEQYYRGLPVIGGRADVRVNMAGRVPMIGSVAFPIPANFNVTPAFDGESATAMAWQLLGQQPTGLAQPGQRRAPRLVIHADAESTQLSAVTLAWEVHVSNVNAAGEGPIGRYYIDAATGAQLRFVSDKHECGIAGCGTNHAVTAPSLESLTNGKPIAPPVNTTVTLQGWTRTGIDGQSALTNAPLPGVQLNVPGIGVVTTDNNGQFVINIAAATTITVGAFDGRHHNPMVGGSAPSGSFTVNPGVATTIQLLTAAATTAQAAHTTTTYWIDRTNEYCRAILGNSAQLNTADAIVPTVNIASTCNAYYTGNTINFYSAGGGCANTSFSTVISHEWGHGIDDRYGGISNTNGDGLSEGWGDIIGMYLVDSPLLGSGFQTAGVALRRGDNTRQYGTGTGVHDSGESWMGFAWNVRDRLTTTLGTRSAAIALSNTIVVGTLVADATNQTNAVREVFIADDNDGNLANGTPHDVDLIWAANNHSIPVPTAPPLANDDCAGAIVIGNGLSGPYSNSTATTSAPAWACGNGGKDLWFRYTAYAGGTLSVSTCTLASWDTVIQIFSGSCTALTSVVCNDDACSLQSTATTPVSPGTYYIRVGGFNSVSGSFSLNVTGPSATPATATPYGAGCISGSKAFYELFPTAAAFDLSGLGMRLVRTGNSYIAQPGGTYVAPTGAATTLGLGDDSITSVNLVGALLYPGGGTTSLEVCSNGFVSVATGNGTAYAPSAAGWLAGTQFRWGTWHDFNPTIAGSGQVKFQQIGQIAYVTWDGVYSFSTTSPNTFQLQFDLANGNVTMVWQSMIGTGNAWLVGIAGAAPNADAGSRDISATLPGTFRTQSENSQPLALASSLPQLGTTATLTTTQFALSSLLGIQILGTTLLNPGVDLGVIGMPGCLQSVSLDVLYVLVPAGGQATYGLVVPNNPSLMGATIGAQSAAFYSEANAFGMVTSNGIALTIGV